MGARRRPSIYALTTLHMVSGFAVFVDIETFAFNFFGDAQPDDDVSDLEGNKRHHCGPDDCQTHGLGLNQELIPNRIGPDFGCDPVGDQARTAQILSVEYAGHQCAKRAAYRMYSENV